MGQEATIKAPEAFGAFAQLFADHAPRLARYFWLHTASASAAETLTSETFLRAWCSWPGGSGEEKLLRKWLYEVARQVLALHGSGPRQGQAACPSPRIGGTLVMNCGLSQALAALSRSERDILALYVGAQLSPSEIAEVTGVRPEHVAVVLRCILGKLRARAHRNEPS